MKSVLFRTGSGSVPAQATFKTGSPRRSVPPTRVSLDVETGRRNIRRCSSESDVIRSELKSLSRRGSFPAMIPEEDCRVYGGGGINKNGMRTGGGGGGGNGRDGYNNKMGDYYKEMLKSDPTNSLLLTNYAKYLHQVEGDMVKAEEYYGRAILASPGDGELLSLYGKLIWEAYRDESRAKSYFQQALHLSPHDCTILGSYAQFLWEADVEDEDQEMERGNEEFVSTAAAMVESF